MTTQAAHNNDSNSAAPIKILYSVYILTLQSCGIVPDTKYEGKVDVPVEEEFVEEFTDTADATVSVQEGSFAFVAAYDKRPVDILIIKENKTNLTAAPIGPRLEYSAPILSARLYFSELDFRLAAVDGGVPALLEDGSPPADLNPGWFDATSTDFDADLAQQMLITPNNKLVQRPLSILDGILNNDTSRYGINLEGFARDNAFLSIIFIQFSDETSEQLLPIDLSEQLDEKYGKEGWMASALTSTKEGCIYDEAKGFRTSPEDYVRRNLATRLQEASGGVFGSLCDQTYSIFFDDVIRQATGNNSFIQIVSAPNESDIIDPATIRVAVEGKDWSDWIFYPATNEIELPTTVTNGQNVIVSFSYETLTEPSKSISETPDDTSDIGSSELSEEEKFFLSEIDPILKTQCQSCHGAASGRLFQVGSFKAALDLAESILDRVSRPEGDPLRMPPAGGIPEGDLTKLKDWLEN